MHIYAYKTYFLSNSDIQCVILSMHMNVYICTCVYVCTLFYVCTCIYNTRPVYIFAKSAGFSVVFQRSPRFRDVRLAARIRVNDNQQKCTFIYIYIKSCKVKKKTLFVS